MSGERRTRGPLVAALAGLIVGAVEALFAVAFATLVFGGRVAAHVVDGIGLYLAGSILTLVILGLTAGRRGVVGGMQAPVAAVVGIVGASVSLTTFGGVDRSFLTVVAATLVVTVLSAGVFLLFGWRRWGNVIRFIPLPVVGGFIAGAGWLLIKGGIYVSADLLPQLTTMGDLWPSDVLQRWGPAFAFGVLLLFAVRLIKRPLVLPIALAIGLIGFVIGMLVSGSSLQEAKDGSWLLSPLQSSSLWQPWTLRALSGADWIAVLGQWAAILVAVLVATIGISFNVSGSELLLDRDLDTNRELRDAGITNLVSGAFGGIPGYHALSSTSLVDRMRVSARTAGLVAVLVPVTLLILGAAAVELIPRALVGGVLVFLGLSFIVEWLWDRRKSLPTVEYVVVLVIVGAVVIRGFIPGVVVGLVMAVVLFAISYGRIELVREVAFGTTYRSNVDRPPAERAALRELADRVQILRVNGFIFFGSANGLLEKIRRRVETSPPRFLLIDLRRVTGVDASAVVAFRKVIHLARSSGFELVLAGASTKVRSQLERGGITEESGVLAFEPDLDRGLQRCEDVLLAEAEPEPEPAAPEPAGGMPAGLSAYVERLELTQGTVLIHQDDPPEDLYVLESGVLQVETQSAEGTRMRLGTIRPGVVVGEIAMYARGSRTADVIAETPAVVLRLTRESLQRMESERPEVAAEVHRWLASTLAERLGDTVRVFDALLD